MKLPYLSTSLLIVATAFFGCTATVEDPCVKTQTCVKKVDPCVKTPNACMPKTQKPQCECQGEQLVDANGCPCDEPKAEIEETALLTPYEDIRINVIGQGVAPTNTISPAQAYALAKRAAITDGYRLIAEKVKGVRVEGQDLIKNMMVKRSTVRTYVDAKIRDANVVETNFKEGLCEVEMEIILSHSAFVH